MQRCHLSYPLLQLKALGIRNLLRFPFLSPPSSKNMIQGLEILFALGKLGLEIWLEEELEEEEVAEE